MDYTQKISRPRSSSRSAISLAAALTSVLLAASSTAAQDASIGVRVGTLGLGIEGTIRVVNPIGVRAGFNTLSLDFEGEADDIDYAYGVDLSSGGLLVDLYLSRSGFRLTGGIMLNGNEVNLESDFVGEVEIGDSTYTDAEVGVLTGLVDFRNASPFAGFGIDTSLGKRKGLGFLFEIGILFQGSPGLNLAADGPVRNDSAFLVELAKEEEAAEDDLSFFKVYPVIALGVTYKFWQGKLTSGDR
ncbi:MAG TPA: hypothetical protein VJB15_00465 [Rhodothermia bacterium]|nr:hypothetical protein [Rhodothermia bacterium]